MKQNLFIIILLGLFFEMHGQTTINLNTLEETRAYSNPIPKRTISESRTGIEVSYSFDSICVVRHATDSTKSTFVLQNFASNCNEGELAYLSGGECFIVPSGKKASLELLSSESKNLKYLLGPAIPPTTSGISLPTDTLSVFPTNTYTPRNIVELGDTFRYNEVLLQNVVVHPVRNYRDISSRTNRTQVLTNLNYRITWVDDPGNTTPASPRGLYDPFLANIADNFSQPLLAPEPDVISKGYEASYVIITTPRHESAAQKLASWKRQCGYHVYIQTKDKWTCSEIKQSVRNLRKQDAKLKFLLIIGNEHDVPGETLVNPEEGNTFLSDYFYGCSSDDKNTIAHLHRGRIPSDYPGETDIVVDKIINYERCRLPMDESYKAGIHCAFFEDYDNNGIEDQNFVYLCNLIQERLNVINQKIEYIYNTNYVWNPQKWNDGSDLPTYLNSENYDWHSYSNSKVNAAIESGAYYVLYRGHGSEQSWASIGYSIGNVNQLRNKFVPIVLCSSCLTGKYNYMSQGFDQGCFAEVLIKRNSGGAVAVIAASDVVFTEPDQFSIPRFFLEIWPESYSIKSHLYFGSLGEIMDLSSQYVCELRNNWKLDIHNRNAYHCFGDPSLRVIRELPKKFKNVTVNRGANNISIDTHGETAMISIVDTLTNNVISRIASKINAVVNNPENCIVTITTSNHIPYIDGEPEYNIYINRVQLSGTQNFDADNIFIGCNKNSSPSATGAVVITENADITTTGKSITIVPSTTVDKNANFKFILK